MLQGNEYRLGRRPALDGLRGLAVLGVVAEHSLARQDGSAGTVGVTLFFVLSGFLITRLLVEEHQAVGSVDLRAFWLRRAGRLLPALTLYLLAWSAATLVSGHSMVPMFAAALYVSNFVNVAGAMGAFGHTWSLAMEEQFYLLWPLILVPALRNRLRWMPWILGAGILLGTYWRASLPLESQGEYLRVAFAPDTRVEALLAGCMLAFCAHRLGGRGLRCAAGLGAAIMLASCAWPFLEVSAFLFPVTIAAALVVGWAASTAEEGIFYQMLTWGPLRGLGSISYGVYLWHDPLAHALGRTHPIWVSLPLTLAAALPLAWLSWRIVERPIQARSRSWRGTSALAGWKPDPATR